jgi:hypothetical protein
VPPGRGGLCPWFSWAGVDWALVTQDAALGLD